MNFILIMKALLFFVLCLSPSLQYLKEEGIKPVPPFVNHTCSYFQGFGDQLNYPDCDMSLRRTCLNTSLIFIYFVEMFENVSYVPLFFEAMDHAVGNAFKSVEICKFPYIIAKILEAIPYYLEHPTQFGQFVISFVMCTIQDLNEKDYYNSGVCLGQLIDHIINKK